MKKIIVLIIILLIIGAYLIKSYNNLNLKEEIGMKTFIKAYSNWVYNLVLNVKDITGYVIQKDWLPKNNTNSTNTD